MTDNEIIKELLCCSEDIAGKDSCAECPFAKKACAWDLPRSALDLITRQNLQIAELQGKNRLLQDLLEAAIAGQETLQRYFLSKDSPDGIRLRYNEATGEWDKYEPYMTIDCPEEKDYEFLATAIQKQLFVKPSKESLADYGCPVCGAYINFDGLNGKPEHAPKYCSECGQRFDWRNDIGGAGNERQ